MQAESGIQDGTPYKQDFVDRSRLIRLQVKMSRGNAGPNFFRIILDRQ